MAFDNRERLYVTGRISPPNFDFRFLRRLRGQVGSDGRWRRELNGPAGIGIDADDNVYVADQNNHRIQKFTANGEYVTQWGERGSGNGQFNMPWGLCVADGHVYVADWRNDRIQKFTRRRNLRHVFG